MAVVTGLQLENIPKWCKNILKRGEANVLSWGKYTKHNKLHNNQKKLQGARLLLGGGLRPLTCGYVL